MDFELVVEPQDHRLEVYVDAPTYLALRARAAMQDRNISQHVRHLIRVDLQTVSADVARADRRNNGGWEGEG